jgi:outer membrane protein
MKPRIVGLMLLLTVPAMAQEPHARVLALAEALATARKSQPQIKQAKASIDAAQARADQAQGPLWPQISASASYQRSTSNYAAKPGGAAPGSINQSSVSSFNTSDYFSAGLNANQLIYDFGQATGRWKSAKANAQVQVDSARTTLLAVDLGVRRAFFNARAAKALLAVARETLQNQERHLAQIQGFVTVGTRPEIDLLQSRTDRANAQVQLINAENGYDSARAQLNQAMGVSGPTDYDVADESIPAIENEDKALAILLEEAIRARPELVALASQMRAQELSLGATKGAYYPTLSASTGLTEAGKQLDAMAWNWNGGLSLSWSIFQGGLTRAQVSEAHANLAGLEAQIEGYQQQVQLDVDQARLAVRAAKAAIVAAGEAAANARERLKLAEGRYAAGVGNSIELGDSQLALTSAEAQKVQADYNLASARATLLKALGRM